MCMRQCPYYNAQRSIVEMIYRKSCFERNHSKMKAFEIVKVSNRQQDKENISSVDRERNENGFYLNEITKEADFMDYLHLK